jgi:hypothetical protein
MRGQRRTLALAQAGRDLDDGVAANGIPERIQQLGGERARPRAEFPDLAGAGRSASATCEASARPNSGVISGAVTKSLPDAGIAPNLRLALA